MFIDVYNNGINIGSNEIDLTTLINQNEYELDLEIMDNNNNSEPTLILKTKMTSIWNYNQKYQIEAELYKENFRKMNDAAEKSRAVRANLDKPFNLIEHIQERENNAPGGILAYKKASKEEYAMADNVENKIKSYFNMERLRWSLYTKLSLITIIGLAFFNMFARADFINILLPLYMLVTFVSGMSYKKMSANLQLFLLANTFTLITDLLWLLFRDSVSSSLIIYL